jgi:molybdopterin molybdotransferase
VRPSGCARPITVCLGACRWPVDLTAGGGGDGGGGQVTTLSVTRKVVVGVMSTGDELLAPSMPLEPGKIRDCNRPSLLSWVGAQETAEVIDLGASPDDAPGLEAALASAAARCDVVVTSGGVSMGEADLLKQVGCRTRISATC